MMHKLGVVLTCVSAVIFPWPFSVLLALCFAIFEPWLPLAAGIILETLYFSPANGLIPFFALGGAAATFFSFFVRSRLGTSIIRG
jgi:hypothetical protein